MDYAVKLCRKITAKIETSKTICFNSKTQSMLYNHDIEVQSSINCWKWISDIGQPHYFNGAIKQQ